MVTILWEVVLENEAGDKVRRVMVEVTGSTKTRCCEKLGEAIASEIGWTPVNMVLIRIDYYGRPK